MANGQLPLMVHYLRRLVRQHAGGEATDHQLLERFLQQHDEAAFEVLVWRHGPMVLSLCQRMLHDGHDAEDVLQATFLALVRKAGSIHRRQSLGSWLHKVAFRIALRLRSKTARMNPIGEGVETVEAPAAGDPDWQELRPILDEAIQRLPEKYRTPVVLCYLQGQSNKEAARQLGCPMGTLSTRLARAREYLRRYLTRRNVTLSAGVVAALLSQRALGATPLPLVTDCVRTGLGYISGSSIPTRVALLTEGVIQAMTWSKLQFGTALLVTLCLICTGVGSLAQLSLADSEPVASQPPPQAGKNSTPPEKDKAIVSLPKGALLRLGTPRSFGDMTGSVPPVFTPDGRTAISVSGNGILLFWDAASGNPIRQFQGPDTRVMAVAVSPDGKLLAVAGAKNIHMLRLPDCQPEGKIEIPQGPARSLAFSATGAVLATGGEDGAVRLWDMTTRKEKKKLPGHKAPIRSVALSPDGGKVYSSAEDGILRFTETDSGKEEFKIELKPFEVNRLAVSPSGQMLATAGKWSEVGAPAKGVIHRWTTNKGRVLGSTSVVGEEITSVAFSPDGKILAAAGLKSALLCDAGAGRILLQFAGGDWFGAGIAFSPDGKMLASCGAGAAVRFWDVSTGVGRGFGFSSTGGAGALAFSPDGKRLATGNVGDWAERAVSLWDAAKGTLVKKIEGHDQSVLQVAFTPDGKQMVTAGSDATLRVWDAVSGKELDKVRFRARMLGVAAGGTTITAVDADSQSRGNLTSFLVWDMASRKELVRRKDSTAGTVAGLSPDNKLYAEVGGPEVRLREVATGRPRVVLKLPGAVVERVLTPELAFSSDGRFMAAVSIVRAGRGKEAGPPRSSIHLWDLSSGQEVATIKTDTSRLGCLGLSDDGRFVAGPSEDGIRVWDTASGSQVHHFPATAALASALVFSPRGDRLASAHLDGTTLLWDLFPAHESARLAAPKLDAKMLPGLWDDLAEAGKAHRAVWVLAAGGEPSVALLRERLRPVPEERLSQMEKYVADLNSERFSVREKAARELENLGDVAEPALLKALAADPSLEVRRRVDALLARMTVVRSPETLRTLRGIQALERIGSPEARRVLGRLAEGAALARETVEARAALERLRRAGEVTRD